MALFEKEEKFYGEINLKYDSTVKDKKQVQIVKGDELTISALVGALIHNLLEGGFDRELLEHGIKEGLEDNRKKPNIEIKEIHITDENAKEFAELLKKIAREDK